MYKKFFWTYFTKYLSSSKSEEFNIKDIEVLVGKEEQPWFKPAHIEKYLGIACIITSTTKLGKEDIKDMYFTYLRLSFKWKGRSVAWITPPPLFPPPPFKILFFSSHLPVLFSSLQNLESIKVRHLTIIS